MRDFRGLLDRLCARGGDATFGTAFFEELAAETPGPTDRGPEPLRRHIEGEAARWAELIRAAGIRID